MTEERITVLLFSVRMPAHPVSVSLARRLVRTVEDWVDRDALARAELATSEIVTNAIRHGSRSARDAVELELEATPAGLTVKVRDSGPPFTPASARPSPGAGGGFGLFISRGLADSMSVGRTATGNEVAMTISTDLGPLLDVGLDRNVSP